jgi:hypothetical protein
MGAIPRLTVARHRGEDAWQDRPGRPQLPQSRRRNRSRSRVVSEADRAYLVSHLEMTREFVRDATRGLTEEQWLFKPAPLRWSIAQCVDHLARTEEYGLALIRERMLASEGPLESAYPSRAGRRTAAAETPRRMNPSDDAIILRFMTDRAPAAARPVESRPPVEEVAPRSSIGDPMSALEHFLRVRAAAIEYARTTQDDLRGHFVHISLPAFPEVKFVDAYQWILWQTAHTERHLMQIHEVKRDENYPGRTR